MKMWQRKRQDNERHERANRKRVGMTFQAKKVGRTQIWEFAMPPADISNELGYGRVEKVSDDQSSCEGFQKKEGLGMVPRAFVASREWELLPRDVCIAGFSKAR